MKKTALITGASSGLGAEFARNFAENGHNVILVARSQNKLDDLARELERQYSIQATVLAKDLSDMDQVQQVYEELNDKHVQVDYLINNAGFGDYNFFHEADYEKLEQMMDLNIKSLTKLTYLFVKQMKARGFGRILNVASTAAFQPGPTMAVYYASKSYVLHFSEAIGNELEGTGITVTTLCPGATATGFQDTADMHESKLIKGKKLPTAKEIADYGYKKMMKGSHTVIPGLMNCALAQSVRLLPRKAVVKTVRYIQEKA